MQPGPRYTLWVGTLMPVQGAAALSQLCGCDVAAMCSITHATGLGGINVVTDGCGGEACTHAQQHVQGQAQCFTVSGRIAAG